MPTMMADTFLGLSSLVLLSVAVAAAFLRLLLLAFPCVCVAVFLEASFAFAAAAAFLGACAAEVAAACFLLQSNTKAGNGANLFLHSCCIDGDRVLAASHRYCSCCRCCAMLCSCVVAVLSN